MTESHAKPSISIRVFEPPRAPEQMRGRGRLKILLLKLDHIGDFITALDAFRLLRQAFSEAEITLICLPSVVGLARSTAMFDKVKGFAAQPDSAQLGAMQKTYAADQIELFKSLLDEPYFLAADFRHDPFDRFGLDHVQAAYRAAFSAITTTGLDIVIPTMEWDVASAAVNSGKNIPPHSETRMTLLAHTIIETLLDKAQPADWFPLAKDLSQVESYKALKNKTGLKVGISVGAGAPLRKWEMSYWHALLQHLAQAHNAYFVFFGGEADTDETRTLAEKFSPDRYLDLTGNTPLELVPSYIKLLNAYIGCDTGLTHLAGKLGLPTVNIFAGISNISVWRARGPKIRAVYAEVICAPCHLRFKKDCPNNSLCLKVISPEIVYACFQQVIALS